MEILTLLSTAFVLAAASGMGIGNAGLMVTFLTLSLGIEQITAQGYNLVFFLFTASTALFQHMHRKKPDWFHVILMMSGGFIGTIPGTFLLQICRAETIRTVFGFLLIIAGLFGLCKSCKKIPAEKP